MRWRIAIQDFTGHHVGVGAPKPAIAVQDYATAEEAEAAKRNVRADAALLGRDIAACVTPIGMVVRRTRRKAMADALNLPVQRKRLTQ